MTDIDGEDRLMGYVVDMGVDETLPDCYGNGILDECEPTSATDSLPDSGPIAGGNTVTIYGENFTAPGGGMTVLFGGIASPQTPTSTSSMRTATFFSS